MASKIAIIGLGYVGLPLARLFATKYPVIGFDINKGRIDDLNWGNDYTLEIDENQLKSVLVSQLIQESVYIAPIILRLLLLVMYI